jgi:thioredoxin reductase (NADPH)
LKLSNGDAVSYRALIIATGVRRRRLNIEGETELRGNGVIESGVRDRAQASGRDVVIVGGGDAAVENALILSDEAASVRLLHRRDQFTARPEFLSELEAKSNIEVMRNVVLEKIEGGSRVTGVEIRNTSTGEVSRLPADIVLVRIGVEPNSQLVSGILDVDEHGYVVVDASGRTSVEGIYAAGDVANPVSPTLNTAAGTGATAAKSAYILIKTEQNGV